jgi:RNA polymerase sigma-70 factor, ECF subfamily
VREKLVELLPSVYRFAFRLCGDQHTAEDLAQDAMLRACRNADTLDSERALRIWLFRVVTNLWIDLCRKNRKTGIDGTFELDNIQTAELTAPESVELDETVSLALNIMTRLPERQRTVLHLSACERMSNSEIAEILNITTDAVKSSLSIARAEMRNMLNKAAK